MGLIEAQQADLGFLPTIVPETWCYTLSEMLKAGLHVVAFDIGAQAERIRVGWRGIVLPAKLSVDSVNNAILAVAHRIRHEWGADTAAA